MARPRFSEMLTERRRQLGLTIQQAANVLRLREDVLIAFEEGDFAAMPKSGYAQGMLSSYARYLNLNSRQVINQFSSDLMDYERAISGERPGRYGGDEPTYEVPGRGRREDFQGSPGLLPTSGGYAGDLGSYATTSEPRSRNSQSSPLVSVRPSYGYDRGERERRYTSRDYDPTTRRSAYDRPGRSRVGDTRVTRSRFRGDEGYDERSSRDRVTTRRVAAADYTDDLRYEEARPYEAASSTQGRRSSRNIANPDRPTVRRRPSNGRNARRQPPRQYHSGVLGVLEAFFADPTRRVATIALAVALILTFVIISSISSCVRGGESTGRDAKVATPQATATANTPSNKADATSDKKDDVADDASGDDAASDDLDKATEGSATKKVEPTVVKVEIGASQACWIEIVCDGESIVAERISGPWSKEFTVTEAISIQVNEPTAVKVTKNGKVQKFDSKNGGVGSMTIAGTKVPDDDATTADGAIADDSGTDGKADATGAAGTGAPSDTTGSEPQAGAATTANKVG